MRDAISDPTAGQRARDISAFPDAVRRRVDPTDSRYRQPRVENAQVMPNPDPTDATYAADVDRPARVIVRRTGRGVGMSLPTVVAARPLGHVHGLARGEGWTKHEKVAGSPVGQVLGRRRGQTLRTAPAQRRYVLRLRGFRSG